MREIIVYQTIICRGILSLPDLPEVDLWGPMEYKTRKSISIGWMSVRMIEIYKGF